MSVKIETLMTPEPAVVPPETTVKQARGVMAEGGIAALPVVREGELLGLVTSTDVLRAGTELEDATVRAIMSEHVYTVPPYADAHVAARVMRNHRIHHVVVAQGGSVVGILSSYDLLTLVEQYRYVVQGGEAPTRRRTEKALSKARALGKAETQRERLNSLLAHLTRRNAAVERDRRREGGLEADFAEQATVREHDEVLDALSKEGRYQIEKVGRALERLDGGDYGRCEDCAGEIGADRLEALPYAVTCIACARKREAAAV